MGKGNVFTFLPNVFSFRLNVFSFGLDVFSFQADVFTMAGRPLGAIVAATACPALGDDVPMSEGESGAAIGAAGD